MFLARYMLTVTLFLLVTGLVPAQENADVERIGVRFRDGQGEFYNTLTGEVFTPRGVNYIGWQPTGAGLRNRILDTALYDRDAVRADFRRLAQAGYNTVRIFFDSCNAGPTCIGNTTGPGLNPAYIANIADLIQIAADEGIYLVLTSNDLPDDGGYWEISSRGESPQFAGYRNAHYLTAAGFESAERYWRDFMTALMAHEPPTRAVLGWSILNEQWFFKRQPPLSLNEGLITTGNGLTYDLSDPEQKRAMLVDNVVNYIAVTSAVIREYDPGTLVTMGFFAPQFPNESQIGGDWYVDTEPLMARSDLDFFDFHAYPGEDITLEQIAENFGMFAHPNKPVIMGEVGAFRGRYEQVDLGAIVLQEWIADSCEMGFDGWLLWDYFGAPLSVGDAAWGVIAEDSTIFNVLAPINQPDPCQTTDLRIANVAFRQSATASRSLPGESPAFITDGSEAQWGAGAHPPQWVEIDLGRTFAVAEVRLQVAQYPAGDTRHQVWGITNTGARILLWEFNQFTQEPSTLVATIDPALPDVRAIRVETLASPSWAAWREIEVYEGTGEAACVVQASATVNLHATASTASEIVGSLPGGRSAVAVGQARGDDGFVWYQLTYGPWVREDIVSDTEACADLPLK